MINYLLLVSSDTAWWRPIGIFCFAILIIFWIVGKVREASREKLENEDKKEDYLKERFLNETFDNNQEVIELLPFAHTPIISEGSAGRAEP